eukprot:363727-Chlamydomonas_euryale.AAC.5
MARGWRRPCDVTVASQASVSAAARGCSIFGGRRLQSHRGRGCTQRTIALWPASSGLDGDRAVALSAAALDLEGVHGPPRRTCSLDTRVPTQAVLNPASSPPQASSCLPLLRACQLLQPRRMRHRECLPARDGQDPVQVARYNEAAYLGRGLREARA